MREGSTFDHVLIPRGISAERGELVKKEMAELLSNQEFGDMAEVEVPKTERQLGILTRIDASLNELRRQLGLEEFHMPPDSVHVVRSDRWKRNDNSGGGFVPLEQTVILKEPVNDLQFAAATYHEMAHVHSYGAIEAKEKGIQAYRIGIEVMDRADGRRRFEPLNEAVTSLLQKEFIMQLRKEDDFQEERKVTDFLFGASGDTIPKGIDTSDIYAMQPETTAQGKTGMGILSIGYAENRAAFSLLIQKIIARTGTAYGDAAAVQKEFVRAMFTGNLLTIGKMIDSTFGSGTFRTIGEKQDDASFVACIESL